MAVSRDLVGYGRDAPRISWPDSARVAVSLVVHFQEGAERTPIEGDDFTEAADPESYTEGAVSEGNRRDLQVESLWEYGPRRGFWRLVELFDRWDVKATFFCAGKALERNPVAAREITARGHEAAGHGYRPIPLYTLSRAEEARHCRLAVETIERLTGERPRGWHSRAPSLHTRQLLVEDGGFLYDSDAYDDDLPSFKDVDGTRFLTIPYTTDVTDWKFWTVPGVSGFTRPGDFLAAMRGTFDRLYAEGADRPKMMSIGMHLRNAGRPSRAIEIERFLRYATGFSGVWFARRIDIARWWLERYSDL